MGRLDYSFTDESGNTIKLTDNGDVKNIHDFIYIIYSFGYLMENLSLTINNKNVVGEEKEKFVKEYMRLLEKSTSKYVNDFLFGSSSFDIQPKGIR